MKKIALCLLAAFFALLSACSSDYYARVAMKRARTYVIDEVRDLSENELDYIRFSNPEWQAVPLFSGKAMDKAGWETMSEIPFDVSSTVFDYAPERKSTQAYGSFVWRFPGTDEVLIVSGTSQNNMAGWYPIRATRRPIHFGDPGKLLALRKVREHILQNLPLIRPENEIDAIVTERIRYAPPAVVETAFLDSRPGGLQECTFIWLSEPQERCVTVSGFAPADFTRFQTRRIMVRSIETFADTLPRIQTFMQAKAIGDLREAVVREYEMAYVSQENDTSRKVSNRIRYRMPVVVETSFLPPSPAGSKEYTLLWLNEPQETYVSVSGYAPADFTHFEIEYTALRPVRTIPLDAPRIGNFTELRDLDGNMERPSP